ncbi:cytochrome b5 domain-containing protein [Rhodopila globiformis]|uniref:Cytochrome B5 n=1 Tax=Rhodopila globiformis TaxID=1071 RepID=A0A2S6MXQ8_RHOGL|nr:cytochrome b5-like heme/steroid binding domain-containing protein [Rhodopila globiformis]PPQ27154.1 cytochrome B5 [Rhodopila globiformis]
MMRTLYVASTTAFWALVIAFWAAGTWAPHAEQPPAAPADRAITAAELARHARPEDCWMAIRGSVYDLTPYLPDHPSRPQVIEPWCGKEATDAYNTKTKGRPHSKEADSLLPQYRIGRFVPDAK